MSGSSVGTANDKASVLPSLLNATELTAIVIGVLALFVVIDQLDVDAVTELSFRALLNET